MLPFPEDPTLGDLGRVFEQSFKASGRAYDNYRSAASPDISLEKSPVAEMASSSPGLSALRQVRPYQAGTRPLADCSRVFYPMSCGRKVERLLVGCLPRED